MHRSYSNTALITDAFKARYEPHGGSSLAQTAAAIGPLHAGTVGQSELRQASRKSTIDLESGDGANWVAAGNNKILRWRSLEPTDLGESTSRHAAFLEEYKQKGVAGLDALQSRRGSHEEPATLPSRRHRSLTETQNTVFEESDSEAAYSDDDLEILEVEMEREIREFNEEAVKAGQSAVCLTTLSHRTPTHPLLTPCQDFARGRCRGCFWRPQ